MGTAQVQLQVLRHIFLIFFFCREKIYPTPETTPPEERVWEAPDERIKWALELLEPKVPLKETLSDRYFAPAFGSSMMFGLAVFHNYTMRQPIFKSNILILAGSAVAGY